MRSIILSTEPIEAIREEWRLAERGELVFIEAPNRKYSDAQVAWYPWHGKWHPFEGKETRCLFVDVVSAIGSSEDILSVTVRRTLTFVLRKP